jgi:nicotinate-nucleotide pyrophosphorylase (carboxylating)
VTAGVIPGVDIAGIVRRALDEDAAFHDITTHAIVPAGALGVATMAAREAGVVAGLPLAAAAFTLIDPSCRVRMSMTDGERVAPGDVVLDVHGPVRALLGAERVALNYVQRLSGIATMTARFVAAVSGTRACILDTRKTTPGWRLLEKYAVQMGGGTNHRMDLAAMALIKDNHLTAANGDVLDAVRRVREASGPGVEVEVEADTLDQVRAAVDAGADRILLDNMPPPMLREAVSLAGGRARLEASGGVRLDTVRAIAESGVDDISVGALTHSAPALDLNLHISDIV